jgi:2-polyprenyl-3-methyl-5-hydroxy-6-metoxy-1,4-benzoquinol methylase
MKFIDNNLPNHTGTLIDVYKNENGITIMKYKDTQYWLDNDLDYANLFLGDCNSCSPWFKNNFNNFNYNSVLVAGLGIGLLPLSLYGDKNCSTVDVLEISQEVIDYANSHGQLNENINLIQGDIHSYTTTKLYDLIIIDTIWLPHEMTEDQWQSLVTKFTNNVNPNGAIYAPVYHKWVTV